MDQLLEEILAQPQAVRATAESLLHGQRPSLSRLEDLGRSPRAFDLVVCTGMGSSFYALPGFSMRLHAAGVPCLVLEASELLHHHLGVLNGRVLPLMVSQSGESVEIVRLLEEVRSLQPANRPLRISLTNGLENTLARSADVALGIEAGFERSIAIKTHTASVAALALIAAVLAGEDVPALQSRLHEASEAMDGLLANWEERFQTFLDAFTGTTSPFLIGRGVSYGSALAGALVLKEGGHVAAEGMSVGAFRHGTLELAAPGVDVLVYAHDDRARALNARLVTELAGYGAHVALIGPDAAPGDGVIAVPVPRVDSLLAPLVEVPVAQLLSRQLALRQGRVPGELLRLPKVIREE